MGDHRSFCRLCAAACGIVVTVDDERVVRVRGDADHPVSRGYTCVKGRALGDFHHREDRLSTPRIDGREVGWDELIDDLGGRLGSIVSESGPDAVAMYLATGFAYDSAAQVSSATWLAMTGSTSFFTAATVDNAPVLVAAEMVAGNAMLNPVWDPVSGGLLVLVGTNPVVSHGYGTTLPDPIRYLREHRAAGGRLWVLDPRRTETAALADEYLSVRPGADVDVLAWLAREVLEAGPVPDTVSSSDAQTLRDALAPFDLSRAADAADVDPAALVRLRDDVLAHRGRLAMGCGTGVTMSADGVVAEWLRWVLLATTDSLDRPGGMRFHPGVVNRLRPPRPGASTRPSAPGPRSRPELPRVVGQLPAVALVDEIEAGNVRALVVAGGNPLAALPEPARVRAALARLEVLVVVDVLDGELAEMATHVVAAAGQLERADLTLAEHVALRPGMQATAAVVPCAPGRRPVWWVFAKLAARMGFDLLQGADPDLLDDTAYLSGLLARGPLDAEAVWAAGSHGVGVPTDPGWVIDTMLVDRTWNLAPALLVERLSVHRSPAGGTVLLAPRREMAWSNAVRYAGAGDEAVIRLHPDTVPTTVDRPRHIVISSAHGSLEASAILDTNVRPGVVSVTHGHPGAGPGQLTSDHAGVDPLTAMPCASGLPVEVDAHA